MKRLDYISIYFSLTQLNPQQMQLISNPTFSDNILFNITEGTFVRIMVIDVVRKDRCTSGGFCPNPLIFRFFCREYKLCCYDDISGVYARAQHLYPLFLRLSKHGTFSRLKIITDITRTRRDKPKK